MTPTKKKTQRAPQGDLILCACGCGKTLRQFDFDGRPRAYVHGHNVAHALKLAKQLRASV